jgi:hypothetical protein
MPVTKDFFFFCIAGGGTQALVHVRRALYHWVTPWSTKDIQNPIEWVNFIHHPHLSMPPASSLLGT